MSRSERLLDLMQTLRRRRRPVSGQALADELGVSEMFGGNDGLRSFTAIGTVREAEPYQFDMGGGFQPFRRDVDWAHAEETPIRPLLGRLDFTAGKPNWGYQLRFGVIAIVAHDFSVIADAMDAEVSRASASAPCRRAQP